MKLYKIRNKKTGLYSTGGFYIDWTKKGKIWNSIGALKNHLNIFREYDENITCSVVDAYSTYCDANDVEIVEIEFVETECNKIPLMEFVKQMENK